MLVIKDYYLSEMRIHLQQAPRSGWSSLPTGLSLAWPRAALGPKFKIPVPRSLSPDPWNICAMFHRRRYIAVSEHRDFENVDSAQTNARKDGLLTSFIAARCYA